MRIAAWIIAFCLPAMAWGQSFTRPDGGSTNNRTISGGTALFYDIGSTTPDSPNFTVNTSFGATIGFDPDIADADVGAEVFIYRCEHDSVTAALRTALCAKVLVDQDLTGAIDNLPLNGVDTTGRRFLFNLPRGWYYIGVQTAPAGGVTARVTITGN